MKKKCLYCGNNPVNHKLAWFDQSLSISTLSLNRRMGRWPLSRILVRLGIWVGPLFLQLLVFLRIAKWNEDLHKAPVHRGEVLWEEAERRGIRMRSLVFLGKYLDVYLVEKNGKRFVFSGLPMLKKEYDSLWWLDDKGMLKDKLEPLGVPVARGGYFKNWEPLLARFNEIDKPVIIKPRVGSRGRHTTTNIHTEEDLKKAFKVAKMLCRHVMLEEHLVGSVYRGTVIDGNVVGILRGDPPRVTGDGKSTIRELVEKKNKERNPLISAVTIKDNHLMFLARSGYDLQSVVPAGLTIDLLEKIGVSYGGSSAEVTPETHPKIFEYLSQAAKAVEYPVIGFDFIIEYIDKDPDTQKWGIIEANSAPFINLHHDPIEGVPINAAAPLWDLIEGSRFAK